MKILIVFFMILLFSALISAQSIQVISPNGGEQLQSFTTVNLQWNSTDIPYIDIDYSTNGGVSWVSIMSFWPASQPLQWNVPGGNSSLCLIKISYSYYPSIFDLSDSLFSIQYNPSYDYIAANEVLMWVGNNGDGSHDPNTNRSGFYWPGGINNTGKSAIFQDGLFWGGKVNGEIRVNGNDYRHGLKPGNILPDGTASNFSDPKFRVYKIKKGWDYIPPSTERDKYFYNFINWPGNLGAPWIDNNNDGIFTSGIDQPDFIGDEVLFYVANDLDTNTSRFTYGSDPIGLEFQTTIFGFEREDLRNVVFKKYVVINKSTNTINDLFFSYFADDDLGNASDDYAGCDTILNLAFCFNGDDNDEWVYGLPPAVGHMFLQTPHKPSTYSDSAFFNNKWNKGFRDTPLTSFVMYIGGNYIYRDPQQGSYDGSLQLYNYMQGKIWDGNPFIDPLTGNVTKFILSGDPINSTGWFEGPGGWPGGPPPADRRYLITTGPINMAPSDTQEVVIAILINRGTDRLNSLALLKQDAAYYRNLYYNNFPVSVDDKNSTLPDEFILYQNYPNPFNPTTNIKYTIPSLALRERVSEGRVRVLLKIYDILGREVTTLINKDLAPGNYETEFNANGLASGVYFYRLEAGSFTQTKKMVVIR